MRASKKGTAPILTVGGPSVVMIFVMLCLTVLGVLSLASANSDLRLARRTADSVAAYYEADAEAQARLLTLQKRAAAGEILTGEELSFSIPCGSYHSLQVSLTQHGNLLSVIQWQSVQSGDLNYDGQPLNVWQGQSNE